MSEPICRTCQYAKEMPQAPIPDLRQGTVLQCRRYPPRATILPTQHGGTITVSDYPSTLPTGWCGEYRKSDHPLSLGAS